jgi:hypothetical protein
MKCIGQENMDDCAMPSLDPMVSFISPPAIVMVVAVVPQRVIKFFPSLAKF